jgi:hypothetical protein
MNKEMLCPGVVVYHTGIDLNYLIDLLDQTLWSNEYIKKEESGEVLIDLDYRNALSIDIPFIPSVKDDKISIKISNILNNIFSEYEQNYVEDYSTSLKSHQPYKIMKYDVGGKFNVHSDDGGGTFRRISEVFYINDEYQGGEIEFINFGISYKPIKGDLIIFPSAYPYAHKVNPVESGIRYSIASWMR